MAVLEQQHQWARSRAFAQHIEQERVEQLRPGRRVERSGQLAVAKREIEDRREQRRALAEPGDERRPLLVEGARRIHPQQVPPGRAPHEVAELRAERPAGAAVGGEAAATGQVDGLGGKSRLPDAWLAADSERGAPPGRGSLDQPSDPGQLGPAPDQRRRGERRRRPGPLVDTSNIPDVDLPAPSLHRHRRQGAADRRPACPLPGGAVDQRLRGRGSLHQAGPVVMPARNGPPVSPSSSAQQRTASSSWSSWWTGAPKTITSTLPLSPRSTWRRWPPQRSMTRTAMLTYRCSRSTASGSSSTRSGNPMKAIVTVRCSSTRPPWPERIRSAMAGWRKAARPPSALAAIGGWREAVRRGRPDKRVTRAGAPGSPATSIP